MNHVKNYLAYLKLFGKSSLESMRINLHHNGSCGIYNINSETIPVFFIFSLGRSGTQLFSRLLNNDPRATVVHEPLRRDTLEYARSFSDSYSYDDYINGFRMKYIQHNVSNQSVKIYGEVNSVLRRHAAAIMANIPNVKGFYIIRDGRDVVRSMMSRGSMSNNWFSNRIIPSNENLYFNAWSCMGRFEKTCWVWASENAILYKQFGTAMKFELLLENYEYFKSNLLDILHLDISNEIWQKERLIKSENRTKKFICDPYSEWPIAWKDTFWEICGDMMQKHGYCKDKREH